MRARDGWEDERIYERQQRRRRIEKMVGWRWMTDRTMRGGFTEEAGNPPKKKEKDKDEGEEEEEVPHSVQPSPPRYLQGDRVIR